jgi:dihydropteroate synthase
MALQELHLPTDRTLVMGILNVTPDSFADGGRYNSFETALSRGKKMLEEGADIIDVGGESTRPGSERISAAEELARVLPVIRALSDSGALISIDTTRAEVASAALDAGARIVNDISAGLVDPRMLTEVAERGVPYIAMHTRGNSKEMNQLATYADVVSEVVNELEGRVTAILEAGISKDAVILDPGIGFAKEADHNWSLLNALRKIESLGFPVLVGASRKRFLGALIGVADTDARESATIALTALLAERKIWGVRVHDVKAHRDAIKVAGKFQ